MIGAGQNEPSSRLLQALADAEDALSRLDARLASTPHAEGWAERALFAESTAALWMHGEVVPLNDLVLHDSHMDVGLPSQALSRAWAVLVSRRRTPRRDADETLSWGGLAALLGRRDGVEPARSAATEAFWRGLGEAAPRGARHVGGIPTGPLAPWVERLALPPRLDGEDERGLVELWLARRRELAELRPSLLGAAALLDLWTQLDPVPRRPDLGGLLVEAHLRSLRRIGGHTRLLTECGRKALAQEGRRWREDAPPTARLGYWLEVLAHAARTGLAELDRLSIARQLLQQRLRGRRSSSHLPHLVELLLARPVVTAEMAADSLRITPQAARKLFATLGGAVHEMTGRKRFRAWRV